MVNFIIALAIVMGGLWLIRKLAKTPPGQARALVQKLAGGAIIAFAGLLALRGQMNLAAGIFVFGLGLLGKGAVFPDGFPWNQKSAGQKSRVSASQLSMELDHDTGNMDGEVLAGPFKGRKLSQLPLSELQRFHAQCRAANDQSLPLLEAWLDRTQGEWRASWGGNQKATATAGSMSREEAYAVLGLKPGALPEDVKSAHKRLMKEFHPDRGGSDYLAAKINMAKEVLLAAT
jgi:hypothetical protein